MQTEIPPHIQRSVDRDRRGVSYDGTFSWTVSRIGFALVMAENALAEDSEWVADCRAAEDDENLPHALEAQGTSQGRLKGLREALKIVAPECDVEALLIQERKEYAEVEA